jgi:hypothetical protein
MMKWQKARILESLFNRELIGRELWVKCQPPQMEFREHPDSDELIGLPAYESALRGRRQFIAIPAACVELLARGPEDFRDDDPVFMTWDEWMSQ